EDAHKHATKELKRLQRMGEGSAEGSMLRTYLEWFAELPWKDEPQKPIDIKKARSILDEDHYGLDKIKRRILEHLAVRKLNPNGKSPILCFVGPPGVGKTSLGQSIARATGRKFQRIALGGVHDEAELPGYTEEEKLEIAKRYLVKRQLEANGLSQEKAELKEEAIRSLIADYTREAGVRSLERNIGAVLRNSAMKIAEGASQKIEINSE